MESSLTLVSYVIRTTYIPDYATMNLQTLAKKASCKILRGHYLSGDFTVPVLLVDSTAAIAMNTSEKIQLAKRDILSPHIGTPVLRSKRGTWH